MCTLIFLVPRPGQVGWVAANRDEFRDRPSQGPTLLGPGLVGPRDQLHGGTWMALRPPFLWAGLTNARTPNRRNPSLRSRGDLVLLALESLSAHEGALRLAGLELERYNPFHLVVAGGSEAYLISSDSPQPRLLSPGIHMVTNLGLDTGEPKVMRAMEWLRPWADGGSPPPLEALHDLLGDHRSALPSGLEGFPPEVRAMGEERLRALDALCVHLADPTGREVYGTRSSLICSLGVPPHLRLHYLEGPPCLGSFQDLTPLALEAMAG